MKVSVGGRVAVTVDFMIGVSVNWGLDVMEYGEIGSTVTLWRGVWEGAGCLVRVFVIEGIWVDSVTGVGVASHGRKANVCRISAGLTINSPLTIPNRRPTRITDHQHPRPPVRLLESTGAGAASSIGLLTDTGRGEDSGLAMAFSTATGREDPAALAWASAPVLEADGVRL